MGDRTKFNQYESTTNKRIEVLEKTIKDNRIALNMRINREKELIKAAFKIQAQKNKNIVESFENNLKRVREEIQTKDKENKEALIAKSDLLSGQIVEIKEKQKDYEEATRKKIVLLELQLTNNMKAESDDLRKKIDSNNLKITALEELTGTLDFKTGEMESEINFLKKEMESEIRKLRDANKETVEDISTLAEALIRSQKKQAELDQSIVESLEELQAKIDQEKEARKDLANELRRVIKENKELFSKVLLEKQERKEEIR